MKGPRLVLIAGSVAAAWIVAVALDGPYLARRFAALHGGSRGSAVVEGSSPLTAHDGQAAWKVTLRGGGEALSGRKIEAGASEATASRDGETFLVDDGGLARRRAALILALAAFLIGGGFGAARSISAPERKSIAR